MDDSSNIIVYNDKKYKLVEFPDQVKNKYYISIDGDVIQERSTDDYVPVNKHYNKDENKYYIIRKSDSGEISHPKIHRLIAQAYIPNDNPIQKRYVRYKDNNNPINHVDNIEWSTFANLATYKYGKGCVQSTTSDEFIARYPSLAIAQKSTGISSSSISKVCRTRAGKYLPGDKNIRHSCDGYHFDYESNWLLYCSDNGIYKGWD